MLHSMSIQLIYAHKVETLYLLYRVNGQPGVIWGHRGQKDHFHKNASALSYNIVLTRDCCICISVRPSTYAVGSKVNLGSFRVPGLFFFCFTKMHYFLFSI